MMPAAKPEKPRKHRSPELLAATAAIELGRIGVAIAKAKETISEKEAAAQSIRNSLSPEVLAIADRILGHQPK